MIRSALLYTALALGANAAFAGDPAIEALRDGSMKKLVFHNQVVPAGSTEFFDAEGAAHMLAEYRGQWVLVNFWATWCPPCRKEMPSLEALNADLGGEDFTVLTIATGRNSPAAVTRFFAETGVDSLPILFDPKSALAREMGVLGLPVSLILDPEGNEVARLVGDADWNGDSARAIITALTAPQG